MKKHRAIIEPKFKIVLDMLDKEIAPTGFGSWHKPNGGYFISFNGLDGTAKRTVELCKQAQVQLILTARILTTTISVSLRHILPKQSLQRLWRYSALQ